MIGYRTREAETEDSGKQEFYVVTNNMPFQNTVKMSRKDSRLRYVTSISVDSAEALNAYYKGEIHWKSEFFLARLIYRSGKLFSSSLTNS